LLKYKIAFIFLIPAFGMLFFSFDYVKTNYDILQNTKAFSKTADVVKHVEILIDTLQKERGLSSGFLASDTSWFKEHLASQRKITAKAYSDLIECVETNSPLLQDSEIRTHIKTAMNDFVARRQISERVDGRQLELNELLKFYADFIEELMSIIRRIVYLDLQHISLPNQQAFIELLSAKELYGQQRAYLSNKLKTMVVSSKEAAESTVRHERMHIYMRSFIQNASVSLLKTYHQSVDSALTEWVNDVYHSAVDEHKAMVTSEEWYRIATRHINALGSVVESMMHEFDLYVDKAEDDAFFSLTISMLLWSAAIIALIALSIMLRRLIVEDRKMIDTLNQQKRFYAALSEISESIVYVHDEYGLYKNICHSIVNNSGFDFAWISHINEEKRVLEPYVAEGVMLDHLPQLSFDDKTGNIDAFAVPVKAFNEERSIIERVDNLSENKACALILYAGELRVAASFPVKVGDKMVALLNLYSSDSNVYSLELISLIEHIVDELEYALQNIEDEKERLAAKDELRLAAYTFDTQEAMAITDARANIIKVNRTFCDITGYSEEEVLGKNPRILRSNVHDESFYQNMWETLYRNGFWRGEIYNRRKDGTVFPELLSISAIKNQRGEVTNYISHFQDITEIKDAQKRAEYQAHHDFLTKLPNRLLMQEYLKQSFYSARRSGTHNAFMFVDLDRFKHINDYYGHEVGDKVLVKIAERLRSAVREVDMVARLSGDEFAVTALDLDISEAVAGKNAVILAEKILAEITKTMHFGNIEIEVTASIGVKIYPDGEKSELDIVNHADAAMYQAKKLGRNQIVFFDKELDVLTRQLILLENELRQAVKEDEFLLHYQPKIDAKTEKMVGAEALLRWHHPHKGTLSPREFLDALEDTSLMNDVCHYVLTASCSLLQEWLESGIIDSSFRLSVNISLSCFQKNDFVERVARVLTDYSFDYSMLEFELVESALVDNISVAIKKIRTLQEIGVSIYIDDFGTGYSSMNYLRQLPVNGMKIDRSFLESLRDESDREILKMMISLAKIFGLKVVVEGVESFEILEFLRTLECDYYQGYYFGRPVDKDSFAKLLTKKETEII